MQHSFLPRREEDKKRRPPASSVLSDKDNPISLNSSTAFDMLSHLVFPAAAPAVRPRASERELKGIGATQKTRMVPFLFEYRMIQTIPGISEVSAATIIAEIGADMSQFPDEAHLSSWAGVSPGNNESAGVKKSGRTLKI
jgi:transposase